MLLVLLKLIKQSILSLFTLPHPHPFYSGETIIKVLSHIFPHIPCLLTDTVPPCVAPRCVSSTLLLETVSKKTVFLMPVISWTVCSDYSDWLSLNNETYILKQWPLNTVEVSLGLLLFFSAFTLDVPSPSHILNIISQWWFPKFRSLSPLTTLYKIVPPPPPHFCLLCSPYPACFFFLPDVY